MKAVIVNAYGDENRGSSALNEAAVVAITSAFPSAEIALVSVRDGDLELEYEQTMRACPSIRVLGPPWSGRGRGGLHQALRAVGDVGSAGRLKLDSPSAEQIASADLVVGRGGYLLKELAGWRSGLSMWLSAAPLTLASRAGVPTLVLGAGIGPFVSRRGRAVAGSVLRRVGCLLPRDPRSAAAALSLGVHASRVHEMPDSVFLLAQATQGSDGHGLAAGQFNSTPYGCVTAMPSSDAREEEFLRQQMIQALRALLDRGVVDSVKVVVQDANPATGDVASSQALVDDAEDERFVLVDDGGTWRDLVRLYAGARFVLASRLHSAIFSMLGGTPSFAVALRGWKTQGVFESLGYAGRVLAPGDFDPQAVSRLIAVTLESEDSIRDDISLRVKRASDHARAAATSGLLAVAGEARSRSD